MCIVVFMEIPFLTINDRFRLKSQKLKSHSREILVVTEAKPDGVLVCKDERYAADPNAQIVWLTRTAFEALWSRGDVTLLDEATMKANIERAEAALAFLPIGSQIPMDCFEGLLFGEMK